MRLGRNAAFESAPMSEFIETARAKINLTLKVLGRRGDGYHALEALVAFASEPADTVTLDTGRARGVAASGPFAAGIAGVNLLDTVLDLIAAAEPRVRLGWVHLEKRLPVAAGIGGGSADAAALLRALRRANPELGDAFDWSGIARRLGADVPVCLFDRAAFMSGTGERLAPVSHLAPLDVVLVNPMVPVPADKTAQVFRALRAPALAAGLVDARPPRDLGRQALIDFIDRGNDLEQAAREVVPAVGDVLAALRVLSSCRVAAMSGAGPTCFGVFDDAGAATAAAAVLGARYPDWWVVATQTG